MRKCAHVERWRSPRCRCGVTGSALRAVRSDTAAQSIPRCCVRCIRRSSRGVALPVAPESQRGTGAPSSAWCIYHGHPFRIAYASAGTSSKMSRKPFAASYYTARMAFRRTMYGLRSVRQYEPGIGSARATPSRRHGRRGPRLCADASAWRRTEQSARGRVRGAAALLWAAPCQRPILRACRVR